MATEETTFLGIPKSQFPSVALRATFMTITISLLAVAISIMTGMRSDMNANDNAIRAEMNANNIALRSEMNANNIALRSEMNANDNALRADIKDIDDRIDALSVETNARLESIERQIPDYNDIEARFSAIERDQTRIRQRLDALETIANPE